MKNKRIIKPNHVFQEIISNKKSVMNNDFVIYFQPNEQSEFLKYGISVGKKIGNAVTRNHIKRQVRLMVNDLIIDYGDLDYQVIIVVKKNYLKNQYNDNQKALESLFKKINQLKSS